MDIPATPPLWLFWLPSPGKWLESPNQSLGEAYLAVSDEAAANKMAEDYASRFGVECVPVKCRESERSGR
jgi:hypothetical protein